MGQEMTQARAPAAQFQNPASAQTARTPQKMKVTIHKISRLVTTPTRLTQSKYSAARGVVRLMADRLTAMPSAMARGS